MKKWTLVLLVLLLSGCTMIKVKDTPKRKVEAFFDNYQTLNKAVLDDLNKTIAEDESFNTEQRNKYREVMKTHYQNIRYNIKDEEINGDSAIVTVEIEVKDYSKVLDDAELYLEEHPDEFENSTGEYDPEKFMDYKLEKLKSVKDEVKYTLKLKVNKVGDKWLLEQIDKATEEKIHGIYRH